MPLLNTEKKSTQVCAQRESVYGSPTIMQECMADHLNSLLVAHHQDTKLRGFVKPYMIGLFLTELKMHRAAVGTKKKDNDDYVDGHNYLNFSEQANPFLPQPSPPVEDNVVSEMAVPGGETDMKYEQDEGINSAVAPPSYFECIECNKGAMLPMRGDTRYLVCVVCGYKCRNPVFAHVTVPQQENKAEIWKPFNNQTDAKSNYENLIVVRYVELPSMRVVFQTLARGCGVSSTVKVWNWSCKRCPELKDITVSPQYRPATPEDCKWPVVLGT